MGEFCVVDIASLAEAAVRAVIETTVQEAAWPDYGTLSSRVKDRPLRRVLGTRHSGEAVRRSSDNDQAVTAQISTPALRRLPRLEKQALPASHSADT